MELLARAANAVGIHLTPVQLERFRIYCEELISWNQRFNLTAIAEPEQIQLKHFLDSLAVLLVWRPASGLTVLDVGTGAGFPALPLKIACPHIRVTLLEATSKKVDFLNHLIERLELEGVQAIHGRAEELAHHSAHREQYQLVVARAVAYLPELAEYCLPFVALGGKFIAYKGASAHQEAQDAGLALSVLGGRLEKVLTVELPGITEERQLIIIAKIARTPDNYPRRPGIPHKRPIGLKGELIPTVNES